ncbi:MAG: GDYXXLXY domain-containing protein [Proteobacteria bacterium]|nr:GDYXXLXY domain-containing protein [Pseudomonadota bacterium]
MRTAVLFIGALVILGFFNIAIYQKEAILSQGQPLYLAISALDPRSMIQGDYMQFRYDIESEMREISSNELQKNSSAVIKGDDNNIAHFVRLYDGKPLANNEKLIHYTYHVLDMRTIHIQPDSFLFQEGLATLYKNAAFAIFQFKGAKDYLLSGLADKDLKEINPEVNEQ